MVVPQDQPMRLRRGMAWRLRMKSTPAPTSRIATSVFTIGPLASAGSLISFGRVDFP